MGKGEAIPHRFALTPGTLEDGTTGDVACDYYHLLPKDIARMQLLNIRAYRFFIAWPHILTKQRNTQDVEV